MSTSQNGWPALDSNSPKLHKWIIPGADRHFILRNGSAGFLLAHFILWFHERVEPISGGVWDDWGYAYRPIRGYSTTLSNHSSGTAADVNATKHPLAVQGTFKSPQYVLIRLRLLIYRGCLRHGIDYLSRKDEMHVEINRGLPACERVARRLMRTKRGKRILEENPGQKAVILS